MRFYAIGKTSRIWTTILWAVVVIIWSSMALAESHRRPYTTWLWLFVAVVNLSNVWTNYWTVETDALVQHSMFVGKRYDVQNLRYAGPIRGSSVRRWLRKALELQVAGFGEVRYAHVAEPERFLEALQTVTPHAEIVLPVQAAPGR